VGYVALVDMVIARNDEFRALATDELERRGLGPFAEDAPEFPEPEPERGLRSWLERQFQRLPLQLRFPAFLLVAVSLVSLGMSIEAGSALTWSDALIYNGAIVAVVASVLAARFWINQKVQNDWISWGVAFVLLPVLGSLVTPWLV
jgi:hypothetical protein